MTIRGSFDQETGRPYVRGLLFIPRCGIAEPIAFLIDTGCDVTTLNPGDGKRIGIDYGALRCTAPIIGVGSRHRVATAKAIIGFTDEGSEIPVFFVELHITPYDPELEQLPSLLGTDVLRRLRMTWDFAEDILDFEVISCDERWDTLTGER